MIQWLVQSCKPIAAIMEEFLTYKERKNRRPEYLKTLKSFLSRFTREMPYSIEEISAERIESWLCKDRHKPSTQCAAMGRLSSFFSYCERRQYVMANPMRRLERPTIERNPPAILSPEHAAKFLRAALEIHPEILGYAALGMFTGIRPSELVRMDWAAVDITPRTMKDLVGYGVANVSAAASKVRYRRIVPIHPTALEWLKLCKCDGPIVKQSRTHPYTARLATKAGFCWSPDILRHTCASYQVALYEDAGRVAHWLGNSKSILLTHYYQLVSAEDCAAFWSIAP